MAPELVKLLNSKLASAKPNFQNTRKHITGNLVPTKYTKAHYRKPCSNKIHESTLQETLFQQNTRKHITGNLVPTKYMKAHYRKPCSNKIHESTLQETLFQQNTRKHITGNLVPTKYTKAHYRKPCSNKVHFKRRNGQSWNWNVIRWHLMNEFKILIKVPEMAWQN